MTSAERAPKVTPVDKTSDRPAFKQIADDLREQIESGRLAAGDRVLSEAQLMAAYGVARMTVRQALAVLKAEGLLLAEHGRGVALHRSSRGALVISELHPAAPTARHHGRRHVLGTSGHGSRNPVITSAVASCGDQPCRRRAS